MSTQNPFFSYCTTYPGGSPLSPGDTTPSTGVEFGGSGPAGAPFVITDNGAVVASGVFNPSSAFIQQLVNLVQGLHRFELRGNASLPETDVFILTVGAAVTLTINSLRGLISGAVIPEAATTPETLFAMSGKAKPNSTIYLRIDGVRQPGLIAVDRNGDWAYNTGTQAAGLRSYTIEGNYDSGPVSTPPRTLIVGTTLIVPTLINVLDANNVEVPEGTSTASTQLTSKGKASPGQQVEVLDDSGASAVPKGKATVSASGDWELSISVEPGAHRLYAKSLYPSNPIYSNVRTLSVIEQVIRRENFSNEADQLLRLNVPLTCRSGLIITTTILGDNSTGIYTAPLQPMPNIEEKYLYLAQSTCRFRLPNTASKIHFPFFNAHGGHLGIIVYDSSGNKLDEQYTYPRIDTYTFEASTSSRASYFDVKGYSIYIDDIEWS